MQSVVNYFRAGGTHLVLGILIREIVIFIREGGFSDQFTLARALFIIIASLAVLLVIWVDRRCQMVENAIAGEFREAALDNNSN